MMYGGNHYEMLSHQNLYCKSCESTTLHLWRHPAHGAEEWRCCVCLSHDTGNFNLSQIARHALDVHTSAPSTPLDYQ